MENQNLENANVQGTEVSAKKESAKKSSPKKEKKSTSVDSINLENVKVNVSKGDKKLADKEFSHHTQKNLYVGIEKMNSHEQKKFRSFIRRKLDNYFVPSILGRDRSNEEKEKSIKEFISFYRKHWKITDFKIENFSQKKSDSQDVKDYIKLLTFVRQTLGK